MAEMHDVEIVMHAFRLARTGNYRDAKSLLAEMRRAFPEIPEDRLRRCMAQLADRLSKD